MRIAEISEIKVECYSTESPTFIISQILKLLVSSLLHTFRLICLLGLFTSEHVLGCMRHGNVSLCTDNVSE